MSRKSLIFRQLFEQASSTFTYILGCPITRQTVIIDPVLDTVERDVKLIRELGLDLIYGLNTHVHADHVTGTGLLKCADYFPNMKSVISMKAGAKSVDILVGQGDTIRWGSGLQMEVRETPGHTNGCATFVCHEHRMAFTGDALLIRGCGRTDFQQGDAHTLFRSVHSQILMSLPSDYFLFPAHDYNGRMVTTVEEERKFNPRFTKSEAEFVELMNCLGLPHPKQIDKSVPANLVCGSADLMDDDLRKQVFAQ